MIRLLGAGEVAHQQRDAVIFRADARRERRRFFGGNAEPVHAGVDMQRRAAVPLVGRAERVPLGELDQAADHRPRADVGEGRRRARQQTVEHVDRGVRRDGAHAPRLAEMSATKNVLQPACVRARATGSMPQP